MNDIRDARILGQTREFESRCQLDGEDLCWSIDGKTYRVRSADDLSAQLLPFVRSLGKRLLKEPLRLEACVRCEHFTMSSMAREMSRGQRGNCELHQLSVEVFNSCDQFKETIE